MTEEEEALQDEEDVALIDATDYRAIEMFLDNNMLVPLETLNNVKFFNLTVRGDPKPQSRYGRMIQDLKDRSECNWQLSQTAKNPSKQCIYLTSIGNQVTG